MAYQYLGFAYLKLREFDLAIESYQRSAEIKEFDWMVHKGLGVAYILKAIDKDDDSFRSIGVEHWNKSLDIKPDQPRLLRLLKKYSD